MATLPEEERDAKVEAKQQETEQKEAEQKEQKEAEKSEHEDKYFVVHGGTCVCDKAEVPTKEAEIVVTKNTKLLINSDDKKFAATEEDTSMKPPAATYGKCTLKPSSSGNLPCAPAFMPKWEKAYDKKTVDGKKILIQLSTLQCTIGGKITIKKHGQEDSVVKEHAENTNEAEQSLINSAVPPPELEIKYPIVSSIILKSLKGNANFKEISSEKGNGVEKVVVRLNEEATFKANVKTGNIALTSWVIYDVKAGKAGEKIITNEQIGDTFKNEFSTIGNFRIEGYGKPKTQEYNNGKNNKNYTDCSIDIEVVENKFEKLEPKDGELFTRVSKGTIKFRQNFPATFQAKFLLEPTAEELQNLVIHATDTSGNVIPDGTQSGKTFIFTPKNSKAKYTITATYTTDKGEVHVKSLSGETENTYVNSISHAAEVIRPETPMQFKVTGTQFGNSITSSEGAIVKWNLNGQQIGTGTCIDIPGVHFLKEGDYVVEAYVNTANTTGNNAKNEDDDWHFKVSNNDVVSFSYRGQPKVGKKTQLVADKFLMPPIEGEKVVWNVFGKTLENSSYDNPVLDITPVTARIENVTCKIGHRKGVKQSINIVQAKIIDACFVDNNGIKILKASWGQTVNMYLNTEYLIGEEINIEVWDDDTFFDDGVANKSIKIYDGKPISLKLDKNVKNKTGTLGKLYVKVFAPKLTLINQGKGFPEDGLIVEDVMSFSNAIIGEENGSKKHSLVDYDDVSWFYVNTTGIKGGTKLFIAVYQKLKGEKPEFLAKLENFSLSEDGVLKAKIDWKKVPKIKQVRVVYIQVKDDKYKVLYSANAAVDKALTTLQFSPTAVKMVENKAAVVVGTQAPVKVEREKQIIFPLLVKPENDINNKWGNTRNWASKQAANMTTFNSNRDGGRRKHAARDLYTQPLETIVAICDGKVLDVSDFYCKTHEVVVSHKTKDGRKFIIRYGELDPDSIKVKVGEEIKQKAIIGKTGKLLKYLTKTKKYVPLMTIGDEIVFMLHFEHFTGSKGLDLKESLSNGVKPFYRRSDLIDSLSILQEGYNNTFGNRSEVNNQSSKDFTEHDARLALMKIYDLYGVEMAKTVESMYRWECKHFKSEQFKKCGAPGMEVSGNKPAPNYGWDGTLYIKHPEYKPIGLWEAYEGKGKSGLGGNAQVIDKKKKYIKFPTVEAGMMYVVNFIQRHNGNIGRWHSLDVTTQNNYKKDIITAVPRIVNSF